MILVDTNVFVDVIYQDPIWFDWSLRELSLAKAQNAILTNYVVYAELHTHDTAGPHIDAFLHQLQAQVHELTRSAAQIAACAFRAYRQRGGTKTGVLPDFFIGAHAQAEGYKLLTRDAGRYKTYFPKLKLICP
jgi:predicted nucleic acid-binding protein